MILKYTSSNGQTFDLKVGRFRTRTADYHNYSWKPQVTNQRFGANVYRFDREVVSYDTLITVFGTLDERRTFLNLLHAAFDHDIVTNTPGRITHGQYYIECFIIASSTFYENPWTQNTLSIYCPYPFWRRDNNFSLTAREETETYEYLDFPYDFAFDYKGTLSGYAMIMNPAVKEAEWKLEIHGAVNNPVVVIGGRKIAVNAAIGAGETLVISSIDKTVMMGDTNLFNSRVKTKDFFDPLPSGEHSVIWNGLYDMDLTVYEERSEPLWI